MEICEFCGREVEKLAADEIGMIGHDLCDECYKEEMEKLEEEFGGMGLQILI